MRGNGTPRPPRQAREAGASIRLRSILPYLRNAQQLSSGRWKASCPVPTHGRGRGDVNPSLELWEQGGQLRLRCHAGCASRAVYQALARLAGHSPQPQQPEPRGGSEQSEGLTLQQFGEARRLDVEQLRRFGASDALYSGKPAVRFSYWGPDGQLRAVQYRLSLDGSERFKWRRGDRPRLYGEWRLAEWQAQGVAELWATEGSSDSLTLWHAGFAALAFPSASSGSLAREFWSHAAQFERVCLCFDADNAGEQLLQAVARECPPELRERAFVVELPSGTKDLSELWLSLGGDANAFKAEIQQLCNSATPLIHLQTCRVAETAMLRPLKEILASRELGELEFLELLGASNLIARGCTTLVAAPPKTGKSLFLLHACRKWIQSGLKIAYLSEETPIIWAERMRRFPELGELFLNEVGQAPLEAWVAAIRELQPDVCVIDVVRRFLNLYDESDAAEVSRAMLLFTELTRELPRLAIVASHHTRKTASLRELSVLDASGSHAFVAEVDAMLLLLPTEHPRQRVIAPVAGRLWQSTPPPLCFELNEAGTEYACLGEAEFVARETEERVGKQQVLYALAQLGESTAVDLAEWLQQNEGARYTRQWVQVLLNALVREGRAVRGGTGKRGDAYRYRLPDDDSATLQLCSSPNTLADLQSCRNGDTDFDFEQQLQQLQQGEFALDDTEGEQLRLVWREAAARGFPPLWVGDLFVRRGRDGWCEALPLIAAVAEQALLLLREQPPPPPPTKPRQEQLFET